MAILSQYLASLCAVNRFSGKYNIFSCDVTDHGKFIILVAGKRRSLLMAGNKGEVYDEKSQRYAENNVTHW